jgi:hypothetical protein
MPLAIPPSSAAPVRPPVAEPAVAGEGDFAQLMAQQVSAEPAPDAGPPKRTDDSRATRTRPPSRPPASAPRDDARRDVAEAAPARSDELRDETAASDEPPVAAEAALAPWLTNLPRPQPEAPAEPGANVALGLPQAAKRPAAASAAPGAASMALQRADGRADGRAEQHRAAPANDPAAHRLHSASDAAAPRVDNGAAAAAAAPGLHEPASLAAGNGLSLPSGFEPAAPASAGPAALTGDGSVSAVPLPVPLESPDFAHELGVQVSVLARDGVHQAELHLNPAEMGPVSVQIALDGEKARIDFGAQAAATRAAIESSLPELAAALRDAGLTLAGGGVSQHLGQRGERGAEERGAERDTPRESAATTAAAPQRPTWRGRASATGVDLYA